MKIDFCQTPTDGHGKPFPRPEASGGGSWTLGAACVGALNVLLDDEAKKLNPTEIYQRGKLAIDIIALERDKKLASVPEELEDKTVKMLKDRIAKAFPSAPQFVYSCWKMLGD